MSTSTEAFRPLAFPTLSNPELDKATEKAKVAGHAAGYAAGVNRAQQEAAVRAQQAQSVLDRQQQEAAARLEAALGTLRTAAAAMDRCAAPVLDELEEMLASAAVNIAESLLGRELSTHEDGARAALYRVLNTTTSSAVHTIRLNPNDLAALEPGSRPDEVKLVADPSLPSGDAIAEYANGYLDARLSTALRRVREALAGEGQ